MRTNGFAAASVAVLLALSAQAQTTIYGVSSDDRFNLSYRTYELNEGDSVVFERSRFIIGHADGSSARDTYARASYYTFVPPGIGLYKPNYLRSNDFDDEASQYCFQRSMESEHFVLFWEKGFGSDPTKAGASYRFDPKRMLEVAEKCYRVYTEELGFSKPGESKTLDSYKIMMFAHYTTEWMAYGSGQDDKCGTLDVNPSAINSESTVAHEIGHTFQYIVGCDLGLDHGWRYGFGANASGGCAWWESCAQWQSYKVYPSQKFYNGWASTAFYYSHLNLLHEYWRYANFFVQDWWCQVNGPDFIGRMWKAALKPEDPVETYKRMTGKSQDDFCKDMYDYASHAITWDIDAIRSLGKNYQDKFQVTMHRSAGGYYEVDSAYCPQNYGFNVLKLKTPAAGTVVKATFRGEAGAAGYRAVKTDKAGWRYGFVAQKKDGTCAYGEMHGDKEGEASFAVPENTDKLWLVVLGAPTEHWRHPWDMTNDEFSASNTADDEQWPYKVKFENTDYKGTLTATTYTFPEDYQRRDTQLEYNFEVSAGKEQASATAVVDMDEVCTALGLEEAKLKALSPGKQTETLYVRAVLPDGSETDTRSSAYAYLWAYLADGTVSEDYTTNDFAYYAMWSYYNSTLYISANGPKLEAGRTYSPKFAICYKHTDGNTYRATVTANITVTE